MAQNQIENTRTFRKTITAASGTEIIPILNAADSFAEYAELSSRYILGKNFFLEALTAAVHLPSYQQGERVTFAMSINTGEPTMTFLPLIIIIGNNYHLFPLDI